MPRRQSCRKTPGSNPEQSHKPSKYAPSKPGIELGFLAYLKGFGDQHREWLRRHAVFLGQPVGHGSLVFGQLLWIGGGGAVHGSDDVAICAASTVTCCIGSLDCAFLARL